MRGLLVAIALLVGAAAGADEGLDEAARNARARAHFERGKACFNLGEYADAVREFEAGYRESPRPLFLYNLAHAARRAGMPRRALEMFRRYLEANPDAPERREVRKQIAELETIVRTAPPDAELPNATTITSTPTTITSTPTTITSTPTTITSTPTGFAR